MDYPKEIVGERATLDAWLDFQRATLEHLCEGLADDRLKERSVPPSSLSLLGLVRHMSEVERGWFRRCMAGEEIPPMYYSDADPDDDFNDLDGTPVAEAFERWRSECARSREVAAGVDSLDELAKVQRPWQKFRVSLRWIMVHMIEEYARHNGHGDFLRERIDGETDR
jgi:uncharacterized damage-inducible protein DinB